MNESDEEREELVRQLTDDLGGDPDTARYMAPWIMRGRKLYAEGWRPDLSPKPGKVQRARMWVSQMVARLWSSVTKR